MDKSIKNIVFSVISISFGVIVFVLAVMLLFNAGKKSYAFGQAIFEEAPASEGLGSNILVTIDKNMKTADLAKYFEQKGLVKDKNVFYVQIILSDYNNKFVAGQYMLNTNMKPTELLKKICSGEFYIDPASIIPDETEEPVNEDTISEINNTEGN